MARCISAAENFHDLPDTQAMLKKIEEAAANIKSVGQNNHFVDVRQLGMIKLTFGIKDFFITHRQDK